MNLAKLFEMQAVLDSHIENEHPELKGQNNLEWKVLALLVELGECANEWRGFKKWSNDQEPRYEKMLEEYVDCLHFILSIGNEIGISNFYEDEVNFNIGGRTKLIEPITNFIETYSCAVDILNDNGFLQLRDKFYDQLLSSFTTLGDTLGFTEEQIEQAYIKKNEINHERQLAGY